MSSSTLPTGPGTGPDPTADVAFASDGLSAGVDPDTSGIRLDRTEPCPEPDERPGAGGRRDPDPAIVWRIVRLVLEAVAGSASALDGALSEMRPVRRVAVDVMIGGGAVASEAAGRVIKRVAAAGGSIVDGVVRLPMINGWLGRPRTLPLLAERGGRERAAAAADLHRLAAALVPAVTSAVLDRIDLTALVRDRVALDVLVATVDIDAVAARIDVDGIARRIDLDAIIDRIDLVDLTNRVIDGIDLPEIIRESTGSVSGEIVRGVRMQGIEADQAVTSLVGRLFRRRPPQSGVDTAAVGQIGMTAQEAPS
jgi:hypothetical protein